MPCYDPRDTEMDNLVRRFCCETLSQLEEEGKPIPEHMKEWWRAHQEWDAEHGRPHKKGFHK
jgi:hypothetical protein